jgi:hypothetical protein
MVHLPGGCRFSDPLDEAAGIGVHADVLVVTPEFV